MSDRIYNEPVYLTSMGGLVKKKDVNGKEIYIFVHPPTGMKEMGLKVGDVVPYEAWVKKLVPFNSLAQIEAQEQKPKNPGGLAELFDYLREMQIRSSMTDWEVG